MEVTIMFNISKNFLTEAASNFMDWLFQKELKKFDDLASELKQQHDSPNSYDVVSQVAYQKEHLNGHKIPIHVNLFSNDDNKVEPSGLVNDLSHDDSN